ncbi:hypothetical protein AEAC466_19055 [Asticcacaulis sp. AC466]|uniref:hypothetical protein n=1 Tax=Asticcacaulis sp. AC466 TaxID=1282362 RepID=UPI0003C40FE5|nr:hypothetical protein [Asticcacaulis sp. AC466]ESQ82018.1 hypothetical protein AEAC466_19055 [Asticcacaulis sp. AC466]
MRFFAPVPVMFFVAALIAPATPTAAQDVKAPLDTPEARSRCLGLSYEVSAMMDQMEKDLAAASKAAGENPTPEQAQKLKDLERNYEGLAYVWANLADHFEDAKEPSDDVRVDLALATSDELFEDLDICDALMEEIDKASDTKASPN